MDKILVFGDSIVYGKWDPQGGWVNRLRKYVDETFNLGKKGNVQVYNLGIPGELAIRMKNRFEMELSQRIDSDTKGLVIIAIGVNDSCPNNWMTNKQTDEAELKAALSEMVLIARKYSCKICFIGLMPVNPARAKKLQFTDEAVKIYDGYISEVAEKESVQKIDLFDSFKAQGFSEKLVDSVHPDEEGHRLIFETVRPIIEKSIL